MPPQLPEGKPPEGKPPGGKPGRAEGWGEAAGSEYAGASGAYSICYSASSAMPVGSSCKRVWKPATAAVVASSYSPSGASPSA